MRLRRYNESVEIKWQKEFEAFCDYIHDLLDDHNSLSVQLMTADGAKRWFEWNDYLRRNTDSDCKKKYESFLTSLGKMAVSFDVTIDVPENDIELYNKIVKYLYDIPSDIGWIIDEFETNGVKRKSSYRRCFFIITFKFKWFKKTTNFERQWTLTDEE